jgi:hypothetical protein
MRTMEARKLDVAAVAVLLAAQGATAEVLTKVKTIGKTGVHYRVGPPQHRTGQPSVSRGSPPLSFRFD